MIGKLFVYGSLKRGIYNHHFMDGYVDIRFAKVVGRLYRLPSGVAILKVPPSSIIRIGDSVCDFQYSDKACHERSFRIASTKRAGDPHNPWVLIEGELYTFNDIEKRFPELDFHEGFKLRFPEWSVYHRGVIPVFVNGVFKLAWAYIAGAFISSADKMILDSRWTGKIKCTNVLSAAR